MLGRNFIRVFVGCVVFAGLPLTAAPKAAPLKNASIVSMVKGGLSDSVIIGAIESSETQFDVSEKALAELKKAGVSQKVIDAMVAAEGRKRAPATAATSARGAARPAAGVPLQQPYVVLVEEKAKRAIPAEKAQIAPVKAKKQDLNSLALEAVVAQALEGLATDAAGRAASELGSAAAGSLGEAAGGLMGGLFKKKPPAVTYVWGVAGQVSSTAAPTNTPKFEIAYDAVPGVNAEEFVPLLVKLVPAKNQWRLLGATKGKEDALQSGNWELYDTFVEEKVAASLNKAGPGRFELTPAVALPPGEYAIVLRPAVKNKKFTGADLTNNQAEGALFNSVWTFSISASGTR